MRCNIKEPTLLILTIIPNLIIFNEEAYVENKINNYNWKNIMTA